MQGNHRRGLRAILALAALLSATTPAAAQSPPGLDPQTGEPIAYTLTIEESDFELLMVPVSGDAELGGFWMSAVEVPWDLYRPFMYPRDEMQGLDARDVDAVSRPTPPYVPMDFGMGTTGYPAVGMTQFAARQFTKWLSGLTSTYYRLPTRREWTHACRLPDGQPTIASDASVRHYDNAEDAYGLVGSLEPNSRGLHDLLGNVAEWVLDGGEAAREEVTLPSTGSLLALPGDVDPRLVLGGSFEDDLDDISCALSRGSSPAWQRRDPQLPRSIWYLTDGQFVGFRVIRPFAKPDEQEKQLAWEPDTESLREIVASQSGER